MVQGGEWSTGKGSCTYNTRGKTRLSDLLRDARWSAPRELQQRLPPRRGVELVESLCPMAGVAAAEAAPLQVVSLWGGGIYAAEAHSSRAPGHIGLRGGHTAGYGV